MTLTELIAHLRTVGVDLWVEDRKLRFKAPTGVMTADLRSAIAGRRDELISWLERAAPSTAQIIPVADPSQDGGRSPLSFAQERLWFLYELEPESSAYNIASAIQVSGRLQVDALAQSLREIARRHEVLELAIGEVDGLPFQTRAARGLQLRSVDLVRLGPSIESPEVRRLMVEEARRPFDLRRGPVARATLVRTGAATSVLLITMHHLVSDGWSNDLLFRELATLYRTFAAGGPSPLAQLDVQYSDFSRWQRAWLEGQGLRSQLDYWKGRLAGAPAALELPTDRPRPPVQTFAGARHVFSVRRQVLEALHALSQAEGATLFMTLLAAFQTLLQRYTGQDDVLVGTPIAGRGQPQVEELIGIFLNTLVLRGDLRGDPTFRRLLRQTRDHALEAYAHQDAPFERLVDELKPDRDMSRPPLFQAMFLLQQPARRVVELPRLTLAKLEIDGANAQFDVTLEMSETADGLVGALNYNTDLFEASTIERMARHFVMLLEGVAADPDRGISELRMLSAYERERILSAWNDTAVAYPEDAGLHHLFEEQVERTPDAVAVTAGDESLSYAELDARANRLAHRLRALGVGLESRVAVCLERSVELEVALLAALKAGAAYVPLSPDDPQERLAYYLEDAGPALVLSHSRLRQRLPSVQVPVLCLDEASEKAAWSSQRAGLPRGLPDSAAYVIYTSGSTGRPKGVVNTHRGICNRLRWMQEAYPLEAGDVVLQKTPTTFDVSVWELFWPLLTGASLVFARPGGHKEPAYLLEEMRVRQITTLHFVPSMLEAFVEAAGPRPAPLPALARVVCSGEALGRALTQRFFERFPGSQLHNLYGPTEAAVDVTAWPCEPDGARASVPIGRPVANTRIYIVDRQGQPTPIGVAGELLIGGVQVARGYRGRADLTAERFVPDPFSERPGARLYRTGDLSRYHESGSIEYLGRLDHQVKIRGVRIELAEIEAVLTRHAAVRESVVLARPDAHGDLRLVAYVVGEKGATPGAAELRDYLKRLLPEAMIPASFVTLDAMPLSPNGKLDRRALPAPARDRTGLDVDFVSPRTQLEKALAEIWSAVLGVDRIGVHDDFFHLGGHSLLATRLVSRVRDGFGVAYALRSVFDAPTIAGMAAEVSRLRGQGVARGTDPIPRVDRRGDLPLSHAQERLWFLDRLEPGSSAYNVPSALRLTGALAVDALSQSVGEVIRRHEALRSTFPDREGKPRQSVAAHRGDTTLRVVDLSGLSEADRQRAALAASAEEAARPFDLARGPLTRATVVVLDPAAHLLLVTLHHAVSDAWSLGILVGEVVSLYARWRDGSPSTLDDLPVQYADYAAWQRGRLDDGGLEDQLAYWRDELAGAPTILELPTDRPRPAEQSYRGGALPVHLGRELTSRVRALSEAEGVTPFMTLLAGFAALLSRYTGQSDVVVGTPIAGRERAEVEGMIGLFVNTLALRARLGGDPTVRELLGRIREAALGGYAHQELPFEKLLDELDVERNLGRSPLFQVMFALQNAPLAPLELGGLGLEPITPEGRTAKFDILLNLGEAQGELAGIWEYASDLFDAPTIARMAAHFERLLASMVANPERRLSELELLGDEERAHLRSWSDPGLAHSGSTTLHALFEQAVERAPDAVALTDGSRHFSYRELDRSANRLAHRLRGLGVGPESPVGLCVQRSAEMVAGILGILKAGGAYVPLDPAHPADRLAFMAADAKLAALVTEESLRDQLSDTGLPLILLDQALAPDARVPATAPAVAIDADHMAYVIYTSGSTGRPKGTPVTHRNVARLMEATEAWFGFGATDVWTLFHSYAFDFSVWEMWGALVYGGKLVVVPFAVSRTPEEFLDLVEAERVTVLNQTPSAFRQLVAAEAARAIRGRMPLRTVVFGGEALEVQHLAQWMRRHGSEHPRLINMYGITETTVHVTYRPVTELDLADTRGDSPIGHPIPDLRVYVREPGGTLSPIGVPGEIQVGGGGVARGYLGRPELTAERFVPDPWGVGERLYRAGDGARWLPDGQLGFLGRIDQQVKIRGFRIEPGEIEAVLMSLDGVRDAAVVPREDVPGQLRLVAYVVTAPGGPGTSELRNGLKAELPDYMVPAAFVPLAVLPLTANGKLDRRALPAPDATRPDLDTAFVAPRGEAEETLARIWAAVLGVARVGARDNFFHLGGDSILSIQIVSKANQAGLGITPRDLFQHQTVAELAAVARSAVTVQAEQGAVVGQVPLTPIQRWFFEQTPADPHHFNQAVLLRSDEPLDSAALSGAVAALVEHHDALRLRFGFSGGAWSQESTAPTGGPYVERIELAGRLQQDRAGALERGIAQAQASLDLDRGPLLRVRHFVMGPGEPDRLLIVIHHLAVDGVSWRILLEDLQDAYRQLRRGDAARLPPKTTSYRQWAHRVEELAASPLPSAEHDYWTRALAAASQPLPVDRPAGDNSVASEAEVTVALSEDETRSLLRDVPRAYRTQINDVLLTAVVEAFRAWTGSSSLVVNLEGHGREPLFPDVDLARTVGWFTTIFPVRLALPTSGDPGAALKSIKQQLRDIPGRGFGYGLFRYFGQGGRSVEAPSPQVSFNYLGQFDQALSEGGSLRWAEEGTGPSRSPRLARAHLLDVVGIVHHGRLRISLQYSEGLHERQTIARLADGVLAALRRLIRHCLLPESGGYTPSDFPLAALDQPALDRLLASVRDVEDVYPLAPLQQGLLFHSVFEPGSGVYVTQLACTLRGALDAAAFKEAWRRVIQRHAVLRTSFHLHEADAPVQIVRSTAAVEWDLQDWGSLQTAERQTRMDEYLAGVRLRGFRIDVVPLMRIGLFRVGPDEHDFAWSHHHSLLDGWSVPIVLAEVLAIYEALRRNDEAELGRPRPYRDYIAWYGEQDLTAAERFWRRTLAGFSEPTPLPAVRASASVLPSSGHGERRLLLSPERTDSLTRMARESQLTLNTLIQGAWGMLLAHYGGTDDVVFGTTVSGRPPALPGVDEMVGLFINTVPTRVQLAGRHRLLPWLHGLQADQAEARQYEYSPLVEVQRWSDVPSGTPLFQSLMVFENYPVDEALETNRGTITIEGVRTREQTNYPLTLFASPGRGLALRVLFDRALFDEGAVDRLLEQLARLLDGMAENSQASLADISVLGEQERRTLLEDWNATGRPYETHATIHELFQASAAATPDAVALVADGAQISYRQLEQRASQLANHLRGLGVGPDVCVAVCLPRTADMVVALLGVLEAGGAYVPLDPAYPQDRVAQILEDARVAAVVTQSDLAARLGARSEPVVRMDADWPLIAASVPLPNGRRAGSQNLAYVTFTSGSTGRPKGVQITHRAVVNFLRSMRAEPGLTARDTLASVTTISFDISGLEIFLPLLEGARLLMVAQEDTRDGARLIDLVDTWDATVMQGTPATWRLMFEAGWSGRSNLAILCGGQALTEDLAELLLASGRSVWNLYGPTETTIWSTLDRVTSAAPITIGRPIANTRVYVLDPSGRPVAVQVAGELLIGGDGVARGYRGRPDLTAERFVPDAFDKKGGGRVYRTGDRVHYRADGRIAFQGRIDHQVKIRGFRIELAEIESALARHPAVSEVVVVPREDAPGREILCAYLVPAAGAGALATAELRSFLAARLPEFMVPSAFVTLNALPLTPNGKIDRRALPSPDRSATHATAASGALRTPYEQMVAGVWSEVLGLAQVGPRDNFFELGGHSLSAARVIARLRALFGVEIPVRHLFEEPTVAGLAGLLERATREGARPGPALARVARTGAPPLSFAQERLWFIDQLEPGNSAYNMGATLKLEGRLDLAALQQAFQEVVRRQDVLRTTFVSVRGTPEPRISPVPPRLRFADLSALGDADRLLASMRLATEETSAPFDLLNGPVVRATVLRLGDEEHAAILTMHHIAGDAWSLGVLVEEITASYRAASAGAPSPLAELAIQYADFAAWQRESLRGELLDEQMGFWVERLTGAAPLELPTDRPRPPVRTLAGERRSLALSRQLTEALGSLGRAEGTTLFMTLLAAFQVLLHRYSGQRDVLVGTPIAGRSRAELEGLIGVFLNTLVMRSDLGGDPTVRELLARVRATALDAYAHQDVPFERLVDRVDVRRDMSRSPIFDVAFVLQNAPRGDLDLGTLKIRPLETEQRTAKFDLTLELVESTHGLRGAIEYATDLFNASTVERMARHFETLLESMVAHPEQRISELPLLGDDETTRLLGWSTATGPVDAVGLDTLHQWFEEQAARSPDAVALVADERQDSYADLDRRANQLAHRLRALGVGPDVLVGLCMERSREMVVGILGILKAGGAYVPLDPAYPADRLAYMLADAGIEVLLTQEEMRRRLPESDVRVLSLDVSDALRDQPTTPPAVEVSPDNIAYVIYTSGSTGRPKGTPVTHRNVLRLFTTTDAWFGFGPEDVWTLFHSYAFDFSVWEIWGALGYGGRLVVVPYALSRDPSRFLGLLGDEQVTVLNQTPSAFRQLVAADVTRARSDAVSLRYVVFGGEALEVQHLAPWMRRHGSERPRLVNMYGITETTVHVTHRPIEPSDLEERAADSPVGRRIPDLSLYVLDRSGGLAPMGVHGEIHVGGGGVARGYLGRPELTAERFVPDPFGAGGRLYRSGDAARWLGDGQLGFRGRIDQQVKVRGFRIELGEIEAVLARHQTVEDVAVIAREEAGQTRLVAYVVGTGGSSPAVGELRRHLQESLPDYMIPSAFVMLDALPLTTNGKLDRAALPAPAQARPELEAEFTAPRTPQEELLAGIWASVLGLDRVGVHDDFFALGGHSLLATQVASRIPEVFGVEVPLRALFEASTVAGLSARIAAASQTADAGDAGPSRVDRSQPLPLSFAQQRLWFLDQLDPANAAYNLPAAVRVDGPLSAAALADALREIERRHEVLRTTFAEADDGSPVQRVGGEGAARLRVVDLSALEPAAREATTRQLALAEAAKPFDLKRGPLFRTTLIRAVDHHVVLFTQHHIVSDAWSLELLMRELGATYEGADDGAPFRLDELAIQYADFASWQRRRLTGERLDAQLGYWRGRLAGAPAAIDLPTDRPRPAVRTTRGAVRTFGVPEEITAALQRLGQDEGATLFMTLLAAFQLLLHRYTGQDDIVVGSPIAGRNRREVEPLIGFFVNSLALRARVAGALPFRDLLAQVRERALEAYAHQDVPFEKLVDDLQPERDLSRTPLFQVMFVLQNASARRADVSRLRMTALESAAATAKFDLTLTVAEHEGGLAGSFEYSTDLFEAATIDRMAAHFVRVLGAVAASPDVLVREVPLLTDAERDEVVVEWNRAMAGAAEPIAADAFVAGQPSSADAAFVPALFERQVELTPDAVAVSSDAEMLSYRALNDRATRLARALGVGPDDLVGLYLERSIDVLVSILAVWKAGGAYLPLDPTHPADRLAFVLDDANPRLVLTSDALRGALPLPDERVLVAASAQTFADPVDARALPGVVSPDQLAYVIYTSGSTGRPKGAMIQHGALASYLVWATAHYRVSEGDGAVVHSPLGFDLTVTSLLTPLLAGRTVRLLPESVDADTLGEALRRFPGTSLLKITPSHLGLLGQQLGPEQVAGLTGALVIGGDALLADTVEVWRRYAPGTRIINEYGPTETVVGCCVYEMTPDDEGSGAVPIGRPIAGAGLYVLDAAGDVVPMGVVGELHIGGAGVSRGYLRRPDLTAELFVPDPFGGVGARLYRSGDVARHRSDGQLEYRGRRDHQVKIRGFRVELGEVDAVLAGHPDVEESVVLDRAEAGGHRQLVAYVVARAGARSAGTAALRAYMAERLPHYMVPSAFVQLERMPLTANGKIDRRALPDPVRTRAADDSFVAPAGSLAEQIARIWCDVLGVDRVGAHDNFFDLGGHSLLATQVLSRMRSTLDADLPLRRFFETPTVDGLARALEATGSAGSATAAPPIGVAQREGPLPLSFAQQRLWLLDRMKPGDVSYNMYSRLGLAGALDVPALRQTVTEVFRRQNVLRARFIERDGDPYQVIAPPVTVHVPVVDLSGLSARDREEQSTALAKLDEMRSFDLATGPLVRFTLLKLAQDEHALLYTTHHIVSDAWSMGVLVGEFTRLYETFALGGPSQLPELAVQYTDFAAWQRGLHEAGALDAQLAYWRERLAGAPKLALPTDRARPRTETFEGEAHTIVLNPDVTAALRALCRRDGVTPFMALLAAFKAQLHRYTGQSDIVVGTDMANRNREEIEGLIGFFINLLVLRTDLGGNPTFGELIARVRDTALDAYAHQDLPFDQLVQELQPERHLSDTPLFQVLFVMQNTPTSDIELPGLSVSALPAPASTSKFDLAIFVSEGEDRIAVTWLFKTDLFERATIERLGRHFELLLGSALATPDKPISELRMVEETKRQRSRKVVAEGFDLGGSAGPAPSKGH